MTGLFVVSFLLVSMKTVLGQNPKEVTSYNVDIPDTRDCKVADTSKCAILSEFRQLEDDCIKKLPSCCNAKVTQTIIGTGITREKFSIKLIARERKIDSHFKLSRVEFYPIFSGFDKNCSDSTLHMARGGQQEAFVPRFDYDVTGNPNITFLKQFNTQKIREGNNSLIIEYNPPIALPESKETEWFDYVFVNTTCTAPVFNYTAVLIGTTINPTATTAKPTERTATTAKPTTTTATTAKPTTTTATTAKPTETPTTAKPTETPTKLTPGTTVKSK